MKKTTLALASFAVLFASGAKEPASPEQAASVVVAKATKKGMPVTVSATGSVETIRTVTLTSQVDGQVQSINIREGQMVKEGDLLITLDSAPYQQSLQKAQAALLQDQEQDKFLKIEEERYRLLLASGAVSQEDYDTHKTNLEKMTAQIAGDEAQVESAKTNLGYTQIRAPFAGKTGAFQVNLGAGVSKNSTKLLTLNQIAPIYVRFSILENYWSDMRARAAAAKLFAAGALKVRASPQGDSESSFEGTLTFVDNAVDSATGMIMMKATFPNKDGALWPGQFVNATLMLSTQKDAIVVPAPAVQSSQQGSYVFIIQERKAQMRPVTVNRVQGDEIVISQGVSEGEVVVIDGQLRLREGCSVSVKWPKK